MVLIGTNMSKPKYDKNTRDQLHELEQDADIKLLVESHNEVNARVRELEEARVVQRQLNAKFEKGMRLPTASPTPEKGWLYRLFKK